MRSARNRQTTFRYHRTAAVLTIAIVWLLVVLSVAGRTAPADRIVFAGHDGTSWDIWSVRPDGGDLRRLTHDGGDERRPAIAGSELLYVDGDRRLVHMDLATGKTERLTLPGTGYQDQPAWLADGGFLYVHYRVLPTDQSSIWRCRRTPGGGWLIPQPLFPSSANRLFPAPAPDGRRFAFTEAFRTPEGLHEEIGIGTLDDPVVTLVTDFGADTLRPAWSPDGTRLLLCSNRSGSYDIWLLDLAGNQIQRLTDHPAYDCDPAWSPDGRSFAFISSRHGGRRLWIKPIDGGPARQVIDLPAMDPVWTNRE